MREGNKIGKFGCRVLSFLYYLVEVYNSWVIRDGCVIS